MLVLGYGMHQVLANHLSIGSFTAFVTYVTLYEQGFTTLVNMWLDMSNTLIAAGRFLQLMERRPSIVAGEGAMPPDCRGRLELRVEELAQRQGQLSSRSPRRGRAG